MRRNSLGMVAGRVASMALGFTFWLVAARFFATSTVGLTAGAVSAMMLGTQLALFGLGSAFIARFPAHRDNPATFLDTTITAVVAMAVGVGCIFLVLARFAFDDLAVVVETAHFAVFFVTMCVLGTINILLDQISMALGRGVQVLTRNLLFGGVAVVAAGGLGLTRPDAAPVEVFVPWVLAGVFACGLGIGQIAREVPGYRYRPRCDLGLARRLAAVGFPNHLLTLAERAPGLVLPVVVTELLSPTTNAYWYAVWMMAWVVCIVPLSVGMALFAETAKGDEESSQAVGVALRISLGLGAAAAAAVAVAGPLALRLLGPDYAAVGSTPLRILVLAVVPITAGQVYFALCRSTGRLREAIVAGTSGGLLSIVAAAIVARPFGLEGMAWSWVLTQSLLGIWAFSRIRTLGAPGTSRRNDLPTVVTPAPRVS